MTQSRLFSNNKKENNPFLRRWLQGLVASFIFPKGDGDWFIKKGYGYKPGKKQKPSHQEAFSDFLKAQRTPGSKYYEKFQGLNFKLRFVDSQLANSAKCKIELFECVASSRNPNLPGNGKHIVYLPGANTYYQACFKDIAAAANETGATIHAYNHAGSGSSTGKVREANDLINGGIAVVNDLLRKGVHPDDIILLGDCYGSAIALEVKRQFEIQENIKIRIVMNNAFKSFKAAAIDLIESNISLSDWIKTILNKIFKYTGWDLKPGKLFKHSGPYQCYVQHAGDRTLKKGSFDVKMKKYREEIKSGKTKSKNRKAVVDTCPSEYRSYRDELEKEKYRYVYVKEEEKQQLGEKFGVDKQGRINAHFADLCECETKDGESAYTGFVNRYIEYSNHYIKANPQSFSYKESMLPKFLDSRSYVPVNEDDSNKFTIVGKMLEEQINDHKIEINEFENTKNTTPR